MSLDLPERSFGQSLSDKSRAWHAQRQAGRHERDVNRAIYRSAESGVFLLEDSLINGELDAIPYIIRRIGKEDILRVQKADSRLTPEEITQRIGTKTLTVFEKHVGADYVEFIEQPLINGSWVIPTLPPRVADVIMQTRRLSPTAQFNIFRSQVWMPDVA